MSVPLSCLEPSSPRPSLPVAFTMRPSSMLAETSMLETFTAMLAAILMLPSVVEGLWRRFAAALVLFVEVLLLPTELAILPAPPMLEPVVLSMPDWPLPEVPELALVLGAPLAPAREMAFIEFSPEAVTAMFSASRDLPKRAVVVSLGMVMANEPPAATLLPTAAAFAETWRSMLLFAEIVASPLHTSISPADEPR